ncbi:glycosyltransferase family 2 protein [Geothrix mesophila]|uniref:glycosyltransferase family 2 protein n=1 Tax=Geothrix mesophila TaxID=2922723 RepID=UPI001FAD567C|nr:glycosyltransferase family 2 protein [Geothrix sp. SG198]
MDKNFHVGIVTVTYNSAQVIEPFLHSLLSQEHLAFTLYLIDNASKDNTLERVRLFQDPRIIVIPNEQNTGVAAGNNQGIRAALSNRCSHVLLINNDTEFPSTLVGDMLKAFESHQCDMVVPKMYYFDDPNRIWCAGGAFFRLRGYSSCHFGEGELDHGQYNTARAVEYCPTCCTLIKKEVFEKIGLMDEKYFVYWDDSDFCYRAMKSGLITYYEPSVKLWHKVSSLTGGGFSDFSLYYGTRNKVYFLLKNRPKIEACLQLTAYWFYLLISPIYQGMNWKMFRARQRGFFAGFPLSLNG